MGKKEKKEKKEKETRYAHLDDQSSGDDDMEGKSPAKTKKSTKSFMTFGSAKKDKEKKQKDRDSREKEIMPSAQESVNISSNFAVPNMGGGTGISAVTSINQGITVTDGSDKHGMYTNTSKTDIVTKSDKEQK